MDWLFQYTQPGLDWSYAMITLVVRFIGVFIVMLVMQVALQIAARVIRRIEAPAAVVSGAEPDQPLEVSELGSDDLNPDLDGPIAAAIALALEIESRAAARFRPTAGSGASAWALAGRSRQLNRGGR